MTRLPFDVNRPCSACGYKGELPFLPLEFHKPCIVWRGPAASVNYRGAPVAEAGPLDPHFLRTCNRCGHTWEEACVGAGDGPTFKGVKIQYIEDLSATPDPRSEWPDGTCKVVPMACAKCKHVQEMVDSLTK